MNDNSQEISTVNVCLSTDKPVRKTAYQVKGVIMKQYPDSEIVPMLNGSYREKFLYPRVQVKILNERIYLIGIAEGVDPIKSILPKLTSLNFGNITFEVSDNKIEETRDNFIGTSKLNSYRFVTPWIALNQNTGKKYRSLKNKDRINYLNKLLAQNIIFMGKEMGVELNEDIHLKLNLSSLLPKSIDDKNWGAFDGEFSVNFLLPNYLGIGNGITRGYGTIFKLLNKVDLDLSTTSDHGDILSLTSDLQETNIDLIRSSKIKTKRKIKSKQILSEEFDIEEDDISKNKNGHYQKNKRKKRPWKKKKISKKSSGEINYNSEEYHKKQHKF